MTTKKLTKLQNTKKSYCDKPQTLSFEQKSKIKFKQLIWFNCEKKSVNSCCEKYKKNVTKVFF